MSKKSKEKFITKYQESDLATLISDHFQNVQSPEGAAFKAVHILAGTVMVRVFNQTFIVTVTSKDNLN